MSEANANLDYIQMFNSNGKKNASLKHHEESGNDNHFKSRKTNQSYHRNSEAEPAVRSVYFKDEQHKIKPKNNKSRRNSRLDPIISQSKEKLEQHDPFSQLLTINQQNLKAKVPLHTEKSSKKICYVKPEPENFNTDLLKNRRKSAFVVGTSERVEFQKRPTANLYLSSAEPNRNAGVKFEPAANSFALENKACERSLVSPKKYQMKNKTIEETEERECCSKKTLPNCKDQPTTENKPSKITLSPIPDKLQVHSPLKGSIHSANNSNHQSNWSSSSYSEKKEPISKHDNIINREKQGNTMLVNNKSFIKFNTNGRTELEIKPLIKTNTVKLTENDKESDNNSNRKPEAINHNIQISNPRRENDLNSVAHPQLYKPKKEKKKKMFGCLGLCY